MAAQGSNLLGRRIFIITDISDLKRGLVDAAMELMQLYTSSLRPDMKVGLCDRRTVDTMSGEKDFLNVFSYASLIKQAKHYLWQYCVLQSAR